MDFYELNKKWSEIPKKLQDSVEKIVPTDKDLIFYIGVSHTAFAIDTFLKFCFETPLPDNATLTPEILRNQIAGFIYAIQLKADLEQNKAEDQTFNKNNISKLIH